MRRHHVYSQVHIKKRPQSSQMLPAAYLQAKTRSRSRSMRKFCRTTEPLFTQASHEAATQKKKSTAELSKSYLQAENPWGFSDHVSSFSCRRLIIKKCWRAASGTTAIIFLRAPAALRGSVKECMVKRRSKIFWHNSLAFEYLTIHSERAFEADSVEVTSI